MILHCDLDLEDSKPIFLKRIWPTTMHHHTKFGLVAKCSTKFGRKKFSDSEDISFRETFTDILKFCHDLDLEHSNPISS